jgi:glyoxylase-like metal-dependent hydrolase (beta-lactamase superfamily II)
MAPSLEYSGHVDPGGTPATRALNGLTLTKMSVGPMDNNAYLLVCRQTRDALLIDAANDANRLLALLAEQQPAVRLIGIVTTHRHADHWQALAEIVTATGAPVLAGAADADDLPVPVATRLQHGDRIAVGSVMLGVIALRGHTPGSVAIRYDEPSGSTHLFTGDSLFPGGPGRTASPEDFTSLMNDLEARVFDELPDDTWVYPGHGDDTTLGAERPHLAEWRARGW